MGHISPVVRLHGERIGVSRLARPQKEGLDYFPHDTYASSDEKIEPLILLYGANGYAFYFIHLEYIYRNKSLEFDISDAETREVICQKLHIDTKEYEQILQTALKKRCFDKSYYDETGKLTSDGVKKRAATVLERRERMRNSYDESKKESDIKKELNKSKVKEKNCAVSAAETLEETLEEPKKKFVKPTLEEVKTYCLERKNNIDPEQWFNHYEAVGWTVGKNHMKDWKAAVRTWEQHEKKSKYRDLTNYKPGD